MPVIARFQTHARSAAAGAAVGLAFSILALGVGVVRALFVLASGAHVTGPSSGDIRLLAFYVGGFMAAGVLIGAFWPALRGTASKTLVFMLGGVVMMFFIVVGDEGSVAAIDTADRIFIIVLGIVFGAAAAYGYLRNSSA